MKKIEIIAQLELGGEVKAEKDLDVRELFRGPQCQILEISLQNGAVLRKHKAAERITVLCISGKGKFFAGDDLSENTPLETGTLLTLEPGVLHEALAEPELKLLVSKFKSGMK